MKRIFLPLLILLFAFSSYAARPALAQDDSPPAGPVGDVRGTVINRNSGKVVTESLEVMLHVLDKDFADKDMMHGQSQPDGKFVFADVPSDANMQFAVMAIYDGVTYFSDTIPANMTSMQVSIDVPVYESTTDLAAVQIDQMHALFDLAEAGLETKEIYVISSASERTVKDVYQLEADKSATLKFPLPADADYIFFKPEDKDRFIKFSEGFADTYPILPGKPASQFMVSYLVPYDGKREYTYTAPLNIAQINLLLPAQADISLQGSNLIGPELVTLQNGESYVVYSYPGLDVGQTMSISIGGKVPTERSYVNTNNSIAVGAAFFGFAIIGVGVWWWRRPENALSEDDNVQADEATLGELIVEIARLDEAHEEGSLSSEEYQGQRQNLMRRAKHIL